MVFLCVKCVDGGRDTLKKVDENPAQFEKAVAALRSLETMEKQYKQNLLLISNAKLMLFYKYL
jgi:hypothetical protein